MDKFIKILLALISLLALSMLLLEILPIELDYDYHFNTLVSKVPYIYHKPYLQYFGIIVAIIMFFRNYNKKILTWILILSIFTLVYPQRGNIIKYMNKNAKTNIAINPQSGMTPLTYAVERNATKQIEKLLKDGANPNESIKYSTFAHRFH